MNEIQFTAILSAISSKKGDVTITFTADAKQLQDTPILALTDGNMTITLFSDIVSERFNANFSAITSKNGILTLIFTDAKQLQNSSILMLTGELLQVTLLSPQTQLNELAGPEAEKAVEEAKDIAARLHAEIAQKSEEENE